MNEYDQKNKAAQEEPESPYNTESEIKIIKRFQPSQPTDDDQIIFLVSEPFDIESTKKADSDKTDYGLQSMPDDDLASLSGFEAEDSEDEGALKNILPQLLKDSIHQSVQESIKEKLSLFDAQVQQALQDQLPSIILKPMNKQFNVFNTLESRTFVTLQKELSKVIQNKMGVSIKRKVRKGMKAASDKLASV
ncbi:hypothetical protein Tco_1100230 [Tanacetum coccineum]